MNITDNSHSNLIINYIPPSLTDQEFEKLFETVGTVKSAKIIRHKSLGFSYGFGFVEYHNQEDASRAVETFNGYEIQDKRLKVSFARPGGEGTKKSNLFLKGIPKTMSEEELEQQFSQCGTVVQCRILRDERTGQRRGIGFVLFDRHDDAQKAIEIFNGKSLTSESDPISVRFADNTKKLKAFQTMTQDNLLAPPTPGIIYHPQQHFGGNHVFKPSPMNMITRPPVFQPTGQHYQPKPARYAPYNINRKASAGNKTNEGHTLFVYNIGPNCNEFSLWQLFEPYGQIIKADVKRDPSTGNGKGYGFVTMYEYDHAYQAMQALNGYQYVKGKPLQVSFKAAK